jgi:hypothetical protein
MALERLNTKDRESVLEYTKELKEAGETCAKPFKLVAERNENFVSGMQYADINPTSFSIEDAWRPHLPRTTQNHLRNLVNTYKSRITKDRPSVTAWPTSSDPVSVASAQVSAKLIEYLEKEMQIDLLLDNVVRLGTMHGSAGFKIVYNPSSDEIEWQAVSVFDFLIDPTAESFEDADWCIFTSWIDPYDAKEMMAEAGVDEDPPVGTYQVNDSEPREGVEVLEVWHKPTSRVPKGYFCKVIGSHAIDLQDYPYVFPNLESPTNGTTEALLPLVYFKVDYRRGYPYADTWLSDAIPEQRQINEVEATLLRLRRETGNIKLVVPNNAVVQQIGTNSQIIVSPEGSNSVGYVNPPVINSLLFQDREYHFKKLYDIAGLNEQLVGVENVKSGTSAKQIAYLSELDGMKHKGTSQSIESMLIRGWRLALGLIQHYYINERVMRIATDGGFDTVAFLGADIQGITVDLAPRAGLERQAAYRVAAAEEDAASGLIPPEAVLERRITASNVSAAETTARRLAEADVQVILSGGQPAFDASRDPVVAATEMDRLAALLAMANVAPEILQIIAQYAQAYRETAAQAAVPVEAEAAGVQ